MKKFALCASMVLFVFVPLIAAAEIKDEEKTKEPSTKLEAFIAKKGKLIIKDSYEIALISGMYGASLKIYFLLLYEPGQETQAIKGLRIEINESGRIERSSVSFLDYEEGESLLKAINYMIDLSTKWKALDREYSEVTFSTKGDFYMGFYQKGKGQTVYSSSGYINKTKCFMSLKELTSMKDSVEKGLTLLKEK
jgi:hypothetical protein